MRRRSSPPSTQLTPRDASVVEAYTDEQLGNLLRWAAPADAPYTGDEASRMYCKNMGGTHALGSQTCDCKSCHWCRRARCALFGVSFGC